MRILDLLIIRTFTTTFLLFVIGAPLLFLIGDIVENLDQYFDRGLTSLELLTAYLFMLPEFISWSFPIAALVAAVFTIHSMTQHREILAAKAGGISFHRLMVPLLLIGLILTGLGLMLNQAVPLAKRQSGQILRDESYSSLLRSDFVFKGSDERTITAQRLTIVPPLLNQILMEVPNPVTGGLSEHVQAREAPYNEESGWMFRDGYLRIVRGDEELDLTFYFDSLRTNEFKENPSSLLEVPEDEDEMTVTEIDRMAANISRSGGDPSFLIVKKEQRTAIAVATLVIILFGGPLATGSGRSGTTYGIGVALGSTILYLLLFRITGAAGKVGAIPPILAAWLPNLIFLVCGLILLRRVKT